MIVTVDGRKLGESFAAGDTLRAVIDRVQETQAAGRLVVSVAINGERLSGEELDHGLELLAERIEQFDLETADPAELAGDALNHLAEQAEDAGAEALRLADAFAGSDSAAATRELGEFVQYWQTCRETILRCSAILETDLTAVPVGGRPLAEHLKDLAERLRGLRDALEARDYVLLADVMRYEMPPLCAQWAEILSSVADISGPQ